MWLIALAVPIQGSAAVTMFGCGPGHHGVTESFQVATAVANEHAQHVQSHSPGAMTDAAEVHDHDGGGAHDQSDSLKAHKVIKGSCTPCASCGVVAALLATSIKFEPVPLADFFVPSAESSVTSFLPDGLERPPRLFLA